MCLVSDTSSQSVRLADSPDGIEGRLEVFVNGTWIPVCASERDAFDDVAASVACFSLGFG